MIQGRRRSDGVRQRVTFVVPCFEEEQRLPKAELLRLVNESSDISLLFVDDGSKDGTGRVLDDLCRDANGRARLLSLRDNQGKGEAVRLGMRMALLSECDCVGYFDADLATPVKDLRRIEAEMRDPSLEVVLGARIQLMGYVIDRSLARHYAGRVFATAASLVLRQPFYDTQCGAKLFRVTPLLRHVLESPFLTRWCFDVELLGRLLAGTETLAAMDPKAVRELPLHRWRDVPGSKVGLREAFESTVALAAVGADLARRRQRVREPEEKTMPSRPAAPASPAAQEARRVPWKLF